jgi:glycosyltransferase involved in cell wall biosynthesis
MHHKDMNNGTLPTYSEQTVVCFSHLRWDFVYQRPQHLLSRCRLNNAVHLWEEPVFCAGNSRLSVRESIEGIQIVTPMLPEGTNEIEARQIQRTLLDEYLLRYGIETFIAWYYTPMALLFSEHLTPSVIVYDCMDELSGFQGAPPEMVEQEQRLFARADVVFSGGASLYASKRTQHHNVHLFPSSIDRAHFARARGPYIDPEDQAPIPFPRIGFYGVLDERLDRDLLGEVAKNHPEWHFVLIGPVVKIHEQDLPTAANIHYLGQKTYTELPHYLSGWNVTMLPFAMNASTRFISPTKTPEYLAAGKPVVSTPIQDVLRPYGELGLAEIAADAGSFGKAVARCLEIDIDEHIARADRFLSDKSWDKTFREMWKEVQRCGGYDNEDTDLAKPEEVRNRCLIT